MSNKEDRDIKAGPSPSEDGTGKGSKSSHQFYELETPRPQSPMPVKVPNKRWARFAWTVKYFLTIILVAIALAVPIIIFQTYQTNQLMDDTQDSQSDQEYKQLVFYLFCWLLITWLSACVSDMFILLFPYIFRFVAG